MKGFVHSFETFGTVDGPGTRFVVFLKGCPMRCKYCHNPDTWTTDNARLLTAEEIVFQAEKYRNYYRNGGVTVSGGEPLAQMDFLTELCTKFKQSGFHVAVDTSGSVFDPNDAALTEKFLRLNEVVDLFLLDIKHIYEKNHIALTGKSNANILSFARFLDRCGKKMWIRYVLVPTINSDRKTLEDTAEFIGSLHNVEKTEVLPYHTLGVEKYRKLGICYPLEGLRTPTEKEIALAKRILNGNSKRGNDV